MGNDGSGWSMSVWPRHIDRTGQDSRRPYRGGKVINPRRKKKRPQGVKRDDAKFEAALAVAIGKKAAGAYIRRKQRRESAVMLNHSMQQELALIKKRLADIERGTVWESNHPGPYSPEEKANEIARLQALIVKMEADIAPRS